MKKTYHGSCHCGAVRFASELDLAPAGERSEPDLPGVWWTSTFRCNCTYCLKTRYWKVFVPAHAFQLLEGQEKLADYQHDPRVIHNYFCTTCGVHPFARGYLEQMGGEFYAVNLGCLDDATPEEFAAAPITYEDGRNDAWDRPPDVTRHL